MNKNARRLLVFALILFFFLLGACSSDDEGAARRKWLGDRTRTYLNLYSVGYNKVAHLQKTGNPCTRGANPSEAALFQAVLETLQRSYQEFRKDCDKKLRRDAEKDSIIKSHLLMVEQFSLPFKDQNALSQCGKLEKQQAQVFFYLKDPAELERANEALKMYADN